MYLIYSTEEAALERADEEGKDNKFAYWTEGRGTRWLTKPVPTAYGKWAFDVFEYELDDLEEASVESSYLPVEVSEEI